MKHLLIICLVFCSIGLKAQTLTIPAAPIEIPDCDSPSTCFLCPCKVTIKKDGKEYWNIINRNLTTATFVLNNNNTLTNPFHGLQIPYQSSFKWVSFAGKWYIENPEKHDGKYIIHIKKKYFKWLNDSTAIYALPKNLDKPKK